MFVIFFQILDTSTIFSMHTIYAVQGQRQEKNYGTRAKTSESFKA